MNDQEAKELQEIKKMLMMLEVQGKQEDIKKTASETQKNYSQAEQAHAIGQDESAQAMQKMGATHAENQMKQQNAAMELQMKQNMHFIDAQLKQDQMEKDQSRKDLEMVLNQRRKMLEAKMDAQLRAHEINKTPTVSQIQ